MAVPETKSQVLYLRLLRYLEPQRRHIRISTSVAKSRFLEVKTCNKTP
jgi:hypothetical protein